jgi:enolase-phosphatase E1
MDVPAATILFVSDVVEELDAATHAYMQTALCVREGNAAAPKSNHKVIRSFDEIVF